jgi:protein-S-isoprenylcysteine O-methyltransferase Ste14
MGRLAVISAFSLVAVAAVVGAITQAEQAIASGGAHLWLGAGFAALKAAVGVSFAACVVGREPARRRSREPIAFAACALALGSLLALRLPERGQPSALAIAGEAIALLGCCVLLRSVLSLGRSFSLLPEARRLVTAGPYRYVRHPVYLGEITICGGLVLASVGVRNLVCAALFAAAQAYRMRLEERALSATFPEYPAYAARTGRLLPRLRSGIGVRVEGELT